MTKTSEALKLAIEGYAECISDLQDWSAYADEHYQKKHRLEETINTHKENVQLLAKALAEAESSQEPVAWMDIQNNAGFKEIKVWQEPTSNKSIPLFTHQKQWQGLSGEEIRDLIDALSKSWNGISPHEDTMNFVRAIEQSLRSKNT